MATLIPEVLQNHIKHCILLEITVDTVTYYVSTAWNPIVYGGNTYTPTGVLLGIGTMGEDIKLNNGDLSITLSGIDQGVIYSVLDASIKGGEVVVSRAFFNDAHEITSVYQRYKGVITSFAITEDEDFINGKLTSTVSIRVASINSVLENRINGQRTHITDRNRLFPGDTSFNRVKDLKNTSFDFGKPYNAPAGINGAGDDSSRFGGEGLFDEYR